MRHRLVTPRRRLSWPRPLSPLEKVAQASRPTALVLVLVVAAAFVVGVLRSRPQAAQALIVSAAVNEANAYGTAHNVRNAVAVYDTTTGAYYGAGDTEALYGSASVMKVFIATYLLASGQMTGSVATQAADMIERSNDDYATALWPRALGTGLVPWVAARYGISDLGSPNSRAGYWGNTHITAHGMVQFYAKAKADPAVGPWLVAHMHGAQAIAADGTNQFFGIAAATTGFGVKQGWGSASADNLRDAIVNSTGYVNNDRFTVAILSEGSANNGSNNSRGFNPTQGAVVTAMAQVLLPGGQIQTTYPVICSGGTPTLTAGQTLLPGASLCAQDGQSQLVMQGDGNLVEYRDNRPVWSTGTNGGAAGGHLTLQLDGNLVLYTAGGGAAWSTRTDNEGAGGFLSMQPDGNLVLYNAGLPRWYNGGGGFSGGQRVNWHPQACTTDMPSALAVNQTLNPGQALCAPDGQTYFVYQGDGNLVVYRDYFPRWNSNTSGRGIGGVVILQSDGNLVMYTPNGVGWQAGTGGTGPNPAVFAQTDGNVVLYNGGPAQWNTGTSS